VFGRSLHAGAVYDEGVYLASLDALAHGQKLGSEVFASQPPGFYLLLEAERAVFGGSVVAIRVAMLVLALIGCVSAYYIGRCLAGPPGGFFTMACLVTPLGVEEEAVRVRADFPSLALSLIAVAVALAAVKRGGAARLVAAALAGGALTAAVSVKLLAATAVIPVLAIVLRRPARRTVLAFGAGVGAVAATLLGLYAGVLGPLWADVVRFHLSTQSASIRAAPTSLAGNVAKVEGALTDFQGLRSPFLWLVLVGGLVTLLAWRRHRLLGAAPLWLWAACAGVFLIWHRPLWSTRCGGADGVARSRRRSGSRGSARRAFACFNGRCSSVCRRHRGEHCASHSANVRRGKRRHHVGSRGPAHANAHGQRGCQRFTDHSVPGRPAPTRHARRHVVDPHRKRLAHAIADLDLDRTIPRQRGSGR